MKGQPRTQEIKDKISKTLMGHPISEKVRRTLAEKTTFKKGFTPWNKGKRWSEDMKRRISQTNKRSIRERDNYICRVCSQYGSHVHHIDYNKKNCNPENLITLCTSCHTKTNFNRQNWILYFNKEIVTKWGL